MFSESNEELCIPYYVCENDHIKVWYNKNDWSVLRIYCETKYLRIIKSKNEMEIHTGTINDDPLNKTNKIKVEPFDISQYTLQELSEKIKMISVFS